MFANPAASWYHSNQYAAQSACQHCGGVVRYERCLRPAGAVRVSSSAGARQAYACRQADPPRLGSGLGKGQLPRQLPDASGIDCIAKWIVTRYGGAIGVERASGWGSTFGVNGRSLPHPRGRLFRHKERVAGGFPAGHPKGEIQLID